jgi:hypothetical protein
MVLDDWVAALSAELGLTVDVDVRLLLDVARDAAHQVDRPAAPLTTFLVGYAAGQRAATSPTGAADAVTEAAQKAQRLALGWPPPAA